ncbi:putative integral membrane protein [Streptomyces sp. GBA 94-10 4N24]|nr:putative integral membrane protein [Streptomyces sp. GBA 94-10 4N24]ESQ02783.1 putative integral membrane protein [Streptomyces sp. PVA_94-07]UZN62554.1 putative integral membrane protein [Streptomyces sp. GBA 94-10 4N24]
MSSAGGVQDDAGDQGRVVVHRDVAAAGEADQAGLGDDLLGPDSLAAQEDAVAAAPGDGHGDVGYVVGEEGVAAGRQGRFEAGALAQRQRLGDHRRRRAATRAGVDGAGEGGAPGGGAGRPLDHRERHRQGRLPHRAQRAEGVPAFALAPESGRREGRDRARQSLAAEFQGEQAAQGVAHHVRAVQPQRLAELAQGPGDGRQVVGDAVRQGGGGAEAGQVHGDDVPFGGEDAGDRLPRLEVVPYAVQQYHRLPGAVAFVDGAHLAVTGGGVDAEGDGGGHAAPRRERAGSALDLACAAGQLVSKPYRSVAPGRPTCRAPGGRHVNGVVRCTSPCVAHANDA